MNLSMGVIECNEKNDVFIECGLELDKTKATVYGRGIIKVL